MISNNETLEKVYTAENHEELMDAYKEWAGDYERDTVQEYGYTAHIESAKALDAALNSKDSLILDAGCGTGLVGLELSRLGYRHMDALDYSAEMLAQAKKKAVYNELVQADLSKPLDLPDNKYDAVNCTGTFTYGHVGANAFEELVRVTRPGGIVSFTIREGAYEALGYQDKMAELEKENAWELMAIKDAQYFEQDNVKCKLCVYKVTH